MTDTQVNGFSLANNQAVLNLDDWKEKWDTGKGLGFHKSEVNENLVKFYNKLEIDRTDLKFFFPLCGKTLDMKWIYDKGHYIVGVEASQKAVEEFFAEHNIKFTSEYLSESNHTLYKSDDGRIKIYCGDLFSMTSSIENGFSAVFDRGSFTAINVEDRRRYGDLMYQLVAKDVCCLLVTVSFDESKWPGPPHSHSDKDIDDTFGDKFDIEQLSLVDAFEEKHKAWGLEKFYERVQLLTLRS